MSGLKWINGNMNKSLIYSAFLLLLISFVLPLGEGGNRVITMLPVFSNIYIESIQYEWITTAVFSVTAIIMAPLMLYLAKKNYRTGLNIVGGVLIICTFFLFAGLFITFHEAAKMGMNANFSYGFIPLILSIALIFIAANKK